MFYYALLSHHPNEFFPLSSHSLLKERLLLSFCLRFSSSRGKHEARAKGMSCARGRLLTRLSRALTPWLIPAIMSSRIKTRRARRTLHALIPSIQCRAKSSRRDASCARGRPLTRISHVPRARLLDLSPSLFALRFFAFPLTESLTHKFKITRNARSTANIYWRL